MQDNHIIDIFVIKNETELRIVIKGKMKKRKMKKVEKAVEDEHDLFLFLLA